MKARNHLQSDFRQLLNLAEDYVRTGYRQRHESTAGVDDTSVAGLDEIAAEIALCRRCRLHEKRRNTVPGSGSKSPTVLVVGEAPGAEEDRSGLPFVGAAGRYLDKWLAALRLEPDGAPLSRRTNTYIANLLKCRPPGNRDPQPGELEACRGYLDRQIELLKPRAILTVSRFAVQMLTGQSLGIGRLRGRVHHYRAIPLVPTYHPSAVLRDSTLRGPVWQDLQILRSVLENG